MMLCRLRADGGPCQTGGPANTTEDAALIAFCVDLSKERRARGKSKSWVRDELLIDSGLWARVVGTSSLSVENIVCLFV